MTDALTDALDWTPTDDDHADRIARLARGAQQAGIDAVVLAPGADMQYFLGRGKGSHERLSALVVTDGGDAFVLCPHLERPGWDGSAAERLGLELRTWRDGEDPYTLLASGLPGARRVAVDDYLPAMHAFGLGAAFGRPPMPAAPVIRELRMRKTPDEVAALTAVGAAIDRVQSRLGEVLRPGVTEAQVAAGLDRMIVEEGHAEAAFIIVGSGPHGASPHHEHSEREVREGDCVVIDIGGPAASGYQSDCTRTYVVGDEPADPEMLRVHDVVRAAQAAGEAAAVAGATCASVDAAARAVIEDAGYGEYFITRTGHGIGFETHEHPYIVAGNEQVLEPGMAFSVEPGVYLPGRFGVRIEDIVVVGEDGRPVSLNRCSKDWRVPDVTR